MKIIPISSHWRWKTAKSCYWSEYDEALHDEMIERSIYAIALSLKLLKRCHLNESSLNFRLADLP